MVVADHPLVVEGESQLEVEAGQRGEGPVGLTGPDGEAAVEVGNEGRLEVVVGCGVGPDSRQAQFLGQPSGAGRPPLGPT